MHKAKVSVGIDAVFYPQLLIKNPIFTQHDSSLIKRRNDPSCSICNLTILANKFFSINGRDNMTRISLNSYICSDCFSIFAKSLCGTFGISGMTKNFIGEQRVFLVGDVDYTTKRLDTSFNENCYVCGHGIESHNITAFVLVMIGDGLIARHVDKYFCMMKILEGLV